MNTVLITGAAGFLGSHLAEHYLMHGYKVIGVDNFSTGTVNNINYLKQNFSDQFYFFERDVSKGFDESVIKLIPYGWLKHLKYIFHFASPASPEQYQKLALETLAVNSVGLQHCLVLADSYEARLIFASTSEIYGNPMMHPQSEHYWGNTNCFGARSCYDEGKRFAEALIYSWNLKHSTSHGLVRIFNTYGPRMNPTDGRVIINFIQQALKNDLITIFGDGRQTRSFCYVDDLIHGIKLYAASELTVPVNLGHTHEVSIKDIALFTKKLLKSSSEIIYKPLPSDDPQKRCPDLTLAKEKLNYSPKISLEEGLLKMADWVKKQLH